MAIIETAVEDATMVSLHSVKADEELTTFIDSANLQLAGLGYTEHGRRLVINGVRLG